MTTDTKCRLCSINSNERDTFLIAVTGTGLGFDLPEDVPPNTRLCWSCLRSALGGIPSDR